MNNITEKLDYALSLLIGTENVDGIYNCKTADEIDEYILNLKTKE